MKYSLDKINEMAGGDADFVSSVVSVFLEEVPEDLKQLEVAVSGMNHQAVYKLSHKIKPNVDLMGMEDTRALALDLENLGKAEGDWGAIQEKFPRLKDDVEQVVKALKNDFGY